MWHGLNQLGSQRATNVKTWRFLTILLTAVSFAAAWAHLLELPAKLTYDGPTWLHLHQTLYPPAFGPVSGSSEFAAVVSSLVLVVLLHRRAQPMRWSVVAATCMLATHAIFWIFVFPVNNAMAPLTPDTLPADWMRLRNQWEYAHAARAVLQLIALAAWILSLLLELPERRTRVV